MTATGPVPELTALQANRAEARLVLAARSGPGGTRLETLREGGGYRIKFPETDEGLQAVIVNTGGGLLGGDRIDLAITARAAADVTVTTQSAEKVYRAAGAPAAIAVRLQAEEGARLHWLPQESILFSGARLARTIDAEIAATGELMIAEAAVFGRLAMGESAGTGLVKDRWRIRRAGRLIHADDLMLDGPIAGLLDRPAFGGGARAMMSLILIAPDAEARLDAARAILDHAPVPGGASAWEGKLAVRLLGPDPAPLRTTTHMLIAGLTGRALPRFW